MRKPWQFRFVLLGPCVSEFEWQACIEQLNACRPVAGYHVLSGSLPPGLATDAYAQLAYAARVGASLVGVAASRSSRRFAMGWRWHRHR